MFNSLKEFFTSGLPQPGNSREKRARSVELSAAVLMLEISLADSSMDKEEYRYIEQAIQRHFQLDKDEADALIELARDEVDHATSLYEFTRLINDKLAPEEKVGIVEMLWRVAHADAVIDKYEEYFIRKIADLLYVSHTDYIKAKHKAAQAVGG
jgi:uncharacterized tellurite resistance protein B-like protein